MIVKITGKRTIADNVHELQFDWPFGKAEAGQFVMIRVHIGLVPLLRRPMSIAGEDGGTASIIFKNVGEGTGILSSKSVGEEIDVLGPLGNPFSTPKEARVIMAGGGVGIPPLLFFARQNRHLNISAVIGGATKNDIFGVEELKRYCKDVTVTTDDGSSGIKGLVTAPLPGLIKDKSDFIIACGPKGMLKAIDNLCKEHGIDGQISTEEKMACGFGVCLGCIVKTVNGNRRTCMSGPVFNTGVIEWA